MNINVDNMPLEIYSDYISDYTQQEWNLEILSCIICYGLKIDSKLGCGYGYGLGCGTGYAYNSGINDYGFGGNMMALGNGIGYQYTLVNMNNFSRTFFTGNGKSYEY